MNRQESSRLQAEEYFNNNNMYDVKEDNNLITRINELLLESYEALQKLPAEVAQLARELFKGDRQVYEADFQALFDKSNELIEINDELHKRIDFTKKINKRLSLLCGILVGLLISSVITIIMLLK
jgi:tetrahydromethanopterin S-methyltransferase subunit G